MSQEPQEFHITITPEMIAQKVSQILSGMSGLSQQQVKAAMQKGAAWLETGKNIRRIRRASTQLKTGDALHFYYSPDVLTLVPPSPFLIADERDYSVWHKPAGLLCQGSKWSDHCTINRWIEGQQPFTTKPQRNCFIVHRLDKAARGLVLIAHTKHAAQALAALFEQRQIEKHYRAVVAGEFPMAEQIIEQPVDGKPAHSIAKGLGINAKDQCSLVTIEIKTGRKHQIRRHLSHLGYPIIGDRLYGEPTNAQEHDLQLQSFSLRFECPLTKKNRYYEVPKELALFSC